MIRCTPTNCSNSRPISGRLNHTGIVSGRFTRTTFKKPIRLPWMHTHVAPHRLNQHGFGRIHLAADNCQLLLGRRHLQIKVAFLLAQLREFRNDARQIWLGASQHRVAIKLQRPHRLPTLPSRSPRLQQHAGKLQGRFTIDSQLIYQALRERHRIPPQPLRQLNPVVSPTPSADATAISNFKSVIRMILRVDGVAFAVREDYHQLPL